MRRLKKILYVWHDCFVLIYDDCALVFDYWKDPVPGADGEAQSFRPARERPAFLNMLNPQLPLYVFISHFHKDHFNPAVYDWADTFTHVQYVVSSDVMKRSRHIASPTSVYAGVKIDAGQICCLHPGESRSFKCLEVTACPSTDAGNSYLVRCGEDTIFHAGDMNAWVFRESMTQRQINKCLGDFRACLRAIKDLLRPDECIDYCFYPVDSRIGSGYMEGAREFLNTLCVKHFFPMHFGFDDWRLLRRDALRFDLYANQNREICVPLAKPYQHYDVI